MKKNILLLAVVLTLTAVWSASVMFYPVTVQAQTNATTTSDSPSLPNPLGKNVNLVKVVLRVLQIILAAVDIFALFMVILGGFEFLISAGNPNMVKKAKDTLVWAIVGILVITLSYSVLKFIFEEIQKNL
ncbi:MAG: hypothetical protein WCT27_03855 [Patescibacteria group bacterium]|jgi:hypothetical protein